MHIEVSYEEMNAHFLVNEHGDPIFLFVYFKKTRIPMMYPNLKKFLLFSFENILMIHHNNYRFRRFTGRVHMLKLSYCLYISLRFSGTLWNFTVSLLY